MIRHIVKKLPIAITSPPQSVKPKHSKNVTDKKKLRLSEAENSHRYNNNKLHEKQTVKKKKINPTNRSKTQFQTTVAPP